MVFLLENEHLNCFYFQLIGFYLFTVHFIQKDMLSWLFNNKKRHLFKSYIFAGMHPLVYLLMKTSIGL